VAFERALAAFQSWRSDAERHLAPALQEAPAFVMAHVLQAYPCLCSRDPARTRAARPVPACRALIAFGRGEYTRAITLLASLPPLAHRIGGSHAQRDVLHLTQLRAVERMRRPARRPRIAA
jgi:hypothetical protein